MKITYQRPYLYPNQAAFVDDPSRFTWIEAGTKVGKTQAMVIWLFEQCIFTPGKGKNFWWVSPYFLTSNIAFDRMFQFIPEPIRHLFVRNQTHQTITFPGSGHKIWFKSGDKPDTLYGEDVYAAVVDEASRMREAAWHALLSTLTATGGRAKIIGNIKGKKNWFYRGASKAREAGVGYYRLSTKENPFIDAKIIEQARQELPASVFAELYECVATDDGSNPFGISYIHAQLRPLSGLDPVCFGIDLAKKQDYTVITGLDCNGATCYYEKFQVDWGQTKNRILALPNKPMRIDSTGVGDPVTEDLQRFRDNIEGFNYSGGNKKQQLMEGLALGIQQARVWFPEDYVDELEAFEFLHTRTGVRYEAPSGQNDDKVNSLALAWSKWIEIQRDSEIPKISWSIA